MEPSDPILGYTLIFLLPLMLRRTYWVRANPEHIYQGKPITITLRSGARYLGILAGADTKNHDLGVAMKWVRLVRAPLGDNSDEKVEEGEYVGGGPEKTMIFEPKDLVDIFAERVPLGDEESQQHSTNQNGKLTF